MERAKKYRTMMRVPGIGITALVSVWFLLVSSGLLLATQPQRLAADRPGFAWGKPEQFQQAVEVKCFTPLRLVLGIPFLKNLKSLQNISTCTIRFQKKVYHRNKVGILFFLNENKQLDVFGGYSHGDYLPNYTGAGFSRRF